MMDYSLITEWLEYSLKKEKGTKAMRIRRLCLKAGKLELAEKIFKKYFPMDDRTMAFILLQTLKK